RDADVAEHAPPRPPHVRQELEVVGARDRRLAELAVEEAALADELLQRERHRDGDAHDGRAQVDARPGLGERLGVGLAPHARHEPGEAGDPAKLAHLILATVSIVERSRRRTSSLPRTSIVSNSGGDAVRPVTATRSTMNRSLDGNAFASQ